MNTTMRTILSAAAAGALIIGTASGSFAAPDKAKGPKAKVDKIQSVSIKGHSEVNVNTVESARIITARATLRDYTPVATAIPTATVEFAAYTKKVNGTLIPLSIPTADPADDPTLTSPVTIVAVPMAKVGEVTTKKHTDLKYATQDFKLNADQVAALKAAVAKATAAKTKVYLCIDDVVFTPDVAAMSTQVKKRIGDVKRPVRDCVKVIDVAP